jgi:hypothetical protein
MQLFTKFCFLLLLESCTYTLFNSAKSIFSSPMILILENIVLVELSASNHQSGNCHLSPNTWNTCAPISFSASVKGGQAKSQHLPVECRCDKTDFV